MKKGDIVKGAIVIAAVAGIIYYIGQTNEEPQDTQTPISQNTLEETQRQIEERFRTQVPEGVDRTELKREGVDGVALATREVTETGTNISILADLPDPQVGFYQAWIEKEDEMISLGRLDIAKGGFVVEFTSERDLSEYDKVMITQQSDQQSSPEDVVIEGRFD